MRGRVEVLAEGRGMSYARHTKKINIKNEMAIQVIGKMEPCKLALAPLGTDGSNWPVVLWPDGTGEIALAFESQNDNGQWESWNLAKLAQWGVVEKELVDNPIVN